MLSDLQSREFLLFLTKVLYLEFGHVNRSRYLQRLYSIMFRNSTANINDVPAWVP